MMEFWMWALGYLGAGTPVGFMVSRHYFKLNSRDPEKLRTYLTHDPSNEFRDVTRTRSEVERLEACASAAVVSGWVGGLVWPLIVVIAGVNSTFKVWQVMAGGKVLAEARREALTAETLRKADELNAALSENWKKDFGPDAPD